MNKFSYCIEPKSIGRFVGIDHEIPMTFFNSCTPAVTEDVYAWRWHFLDIFIFWYQSRSEILGNLFNNFSFNLAIFSSNEGKETILNELTQILKSSWKIKIPDLLEAKHRESPRKYCARDWVFFVCLKKFRVDQNKSARFWFCPTVLQASFRSE